MNAASPRSAASATCILTRARHRLATLLAGALCALPTVATTPLADGPVASATTGAGVGGNVVLAPSVEFPTAVSVAHIGDFSSANTYIGYFDPNKCYRYRYDLPAAEKRFDPIGAATNRTCPTTMWSGPISDWANRWSGNFLNWLSMQTIDPFRWALTGGYRVQDTTTLTVLEKAWASGQGGTGNFPDRTATVEQVMGITKSAGFGATFRVAGQGNRVLIDPGTGNLLDAPNPLMDWNPETILAGCGPGPGPYPACGGGLRSAVFQIYIRVKVCDTTAGTGPLESNCTLYPNGSYKPTGLMQQYSDRMRFATLGYLNTGWDGWNIDGGVLRARMKWIGPQRRNASGALETNPNREWDPQTGIFVRNPDSADAAATLAEYGVAVDDSGAINYLNKFGSMFPANGYKTLDPVSELFYGALRYLKNQGNVPAWSAMGWWIDTATRTRWIDGFPVINSWGDPVQYSCQRNAIIGIGDVNTWYDRNLPGATGSGEPAQPPEVANDTTVNATTATNKVGELHGIPNLANEFGLASGALIAGLAYDANTRDIRPDLSGRQTAQTFWMDVLEYQSFQPNNKYYLAAKYGAFEAPADFDPYARTTDIPADWWQSGDTIGGQPRPRGYFTAANADQVVAGLSNVFTDISTRIQRFSASLGLALPQIANTGTASFAASYDSARWSGDLVARELAVDANGTPTTVTRWSFATLLGTQAGGTGWDGGRRIATWNPASGTGAGAPFRLASLSAAQQSALDTAYRSGNDAADYLNYLRGDRTHEAGSTAPGSSQAYRRRTSLVGDVLRGRPRIVGRPELPYSDATNPGYSAFKTARAARSPVAYFGSNGGMLHAVDARLTGTGAGQELFAYVPSPLFSGPTSTPDTNGLRALGDPAYVHRNYVDSPPVVADVDFNRTSGASGSPDWRTILVGGLGKGGRAYYALDVTDPATATTEATLASRVLWEFTDADLGYTYGEPLVFKTAAYGWVVAFASGYNNATGRGYVYLVNARTGALLKKFDTGVGTATAQAGLAHLQSFLKDRTDGTADALYGGDLLGNLWRFDISANNGNSYPSPLRLAQLTDGTGAALPVTSRPQVLVHGASKRRYVTVGTGRLLDTGDLSSTTVQRFFGIMDGTAAAPGSTSDLPAGWSFPLGSSRFVQVTDPTQALTINPATHRGWYLDLGATGDTGWRVVDEPRSFNGIVAFTAIRAPTNSTPCSVSGFESRVYALEVSTAQSRLRALGGLGTAYVPYVTPVEGQVTDLRFVSVAGKARLLAGGDGGTVANVPGDFGGTSGPRMLGWREIVR